MGEKKHGFRCLDFPNKSYPMKAWSRMERQFQKFGATKWLWKLGMPPVNGNLTRENDDFYYQLWGYPIFDSNKLVTSVTLRSTPPLFQQFGSIVVWNELKNEGTLVDTKIAGGCSKNQSDNGFWLLPSVPIFTSFIRIGSISPLYPHYITTLVGQFPIFLG